LPFLVYANFLFPTRGIVVLLGLGPDHDVVKALVIVVISIFIRRVEQAEKSEQAEGAGFKNGGRGKSRQLLHLQPAVFLGTALKTTHKTTVILG
jgi:hypothetical protein